MSKKYTNIWISISLLVTLPTNAIRRLDNSFDSFDSVSRNDPSVKYDSNDHHKLRQATTSAVLTPPTPEEHLVTDLPLLDPSSGIKHYAGHIPLDYNKDDKAFFYWLFENTDDVADEESVPLLIWLNGGPACSSMDGLFLENGPFHIIDTDTENPKITVRSQSWHHAPAHVVYIDQPVGTGLSYTKSKTYCKNDAEINKDFYSFLQNFLRVHASLFLNEDGSKTRRKVFFSGESHAGHYIPSMMKYILDRNDESDGVFIDLEGAAIGNGWINPYHQYAAAEITYGAGMIDLSQKRKLDKDEEKCKKDLNKGKLTSSKCFALLDVIVSNSNPGSSKRVSQYDYRRFEEANSYPPGKKDVERYLGGKTYKHSSQSMKLLSEKVLQKIHATEASVAKQYYLECTDPPYFALKHQDGLGVATDVEALLERGMRMLFFNGMNDLICNHVGNEIVLDNLEWKEIDNWKKASRFVWRPNDASHNDGPAGYMREYSNLSYLKIRNAGHMVPLDQPEISLAMISLFLQNKSFQTGRQKILNSAERSSTCPQCESCDIQSSSIPQSPSTQQEQSIEDVTSSDDIVIKRNHAIISAWLAVVALCVVSFVFMKHTFKRDTRSMHMYELPPSQNNFEGDDFNDHSTSTRPRID